MRESPTIPMVVLFTALQKSAASKFLKLHSCGPARPELELRVLAFVGVQTCVWKVPLGAVELIPSLPGHRLSPTGM